MLSRRQRNAAARAAKNRAGHSGLGIYDPKLPSPRRLPEDARDVYDTAYADAMKRYGDDETASATAWRTVRMGWRKQGRRHWQRCANGSCGWPHDMVLPQPGDLVGLGVLVEYAFVSPSGELETRRFAGDEPTLYWDEKNKAMYAFPNAPYQACSLRVDEQGEDRPLYDRTGRESTAITRADAMMQSVRDARALVQRMQEQEAAARRSGRQMGQSKRSIKPALETYERWHQREPTCFDEIEIPAVQIRCVGPSDTVSYRSDKWHDKNPDPRVRGAQEYIHHHYTDVWTYQDIDDPKRRPNVIYVTGGYLDLHERGLIH